MNYRLLTARMKYNFVNLLQLKTLYSKKKLKQLLCNLANVGFILATS